MVNEDLLLLQAKTKELEEMNMEKEKEIIKLRSMIRFLMTKNAPVDFTWGDKDGKRKD